MKGNGKWIYTTEGFRRKLMRIPTLITCISRSKMVRNAGYAPTPYGPKPHVLLQHLFRLKWSTTLVSRQAYAILQIAGFPSHPVVHKISWYISLPVGY